MAFTLSQQSFDDDYSCNGYSSESSSPDTPMMIPLLMTDVDGVQKFVHGKRAAMKLNLRVQQANEVKHSMEPENTFPQVTEKKSNLPYAAAAKVVSKHTKKGSHGLAPRGMTVPVKGKAFVVGGLGIGHQPLRESNQEKYNRIKEEREAKKSRKDKRATTKLKKEGKLRTLAPFMLS
jgi:hypothetical protein